MKVEKHGPEPTRRDFTRSMGAALFVITGTAQAQGVPTVYFADGYHGGVKGHMPAGAWRDILNVMREIPQWKLSLDIEPESWDVLRRDDPQAYQELKSYLDKQPVDARVEMVAGTLSQPYGWAVSGESNIRQLLLGRKLIRKHFPKAVPVTYAVQEPCWASCLPQILVSLGYTGACLKDPGTAWGGYSAGFDAEVVNWVGPDGSSIPTVPRYACENLQKVWETESADAKPEFARKCVANGIARPAGMYFQDLGWAAKPRVSGVHIQYVTWREYIHTIASKPTKEWRFSMEDILTALPWGEKTIKVVAQQVRSAENRLLMAEKMAAMAWMERSTPWPEAALERAWYDVLWAQGHDAWITATTRQGRQAWAFQIASGTMNTETTANEVIADSAAALARGEAVAPGEKPLRTQWVRVFNTLAIARTELTELTMDTDRGTLGLRVLDAQGKEVTSQVAPRRRYGRGERINSASVLFRPQVPAMGYASYRIQPIYEAPPAGGTGTTSARTESDGSAILESDLYRIRLDPARGGAITSLYAKQLQREFCDPAAERLFNEYRGYFITQKQWRSSVESRARIQIVQSGPLRAEVRVTGQVGGVPYQSTITLVEGQRRIDFQSRFTFAEDTWIGDPWDIKPEDRRTEPRRSSHDGRWKLQAHFPAALKGQAIYKNAAYDVCRSRNKDTHFQRWDEIKQNLIINWVDLFDEGEKTGLALFSDHTTAYSHGPDHPLALVLAWGWEGGFWWGKCPLRGVHQASYAILPHTGLWDEARLSEETTRWNEPLIAQLMDSGPAQQADSRSFVTVSGRGIEISAAVVEDRSVSIRLFNGEGDASERTVSLQAAPTRVELVELDGRVIRQLPVRRASNGRYAVSLSLPRFGIRTLRIGLASPARVRA